MQNEIIAEQNFCSAIIVFSLPFIALTPPNMSGIVFNTHNGGV